MLDLYRIIQGCFHFNVGSSVYLFKEPTSDIVYSSFLYGKKIYEEAYGNGSLTDSEISGLLIDQDFWNPTFEKELEEAYKKLDKNKLEAYKSFFNSRSLREHKYSIYNCEIHIRDLLSKKHQLDFLGCDFVSEYGRSLFILDKCTTRLSGKGHTLQAVLDCYQKEMFDQESIRAIARDDSWRSMWVASKREKSLFGRSATDLSRDQLALISFSNMYDNVYEHPECPDEKIIKDDDCLDGWFIFQSEKAKKEKSKSKVDNLIGNNKIRDSKEVFIMAGNEEDAKQIMDINDNYTKNVISQRRSVINEKERVKDFDFTDIKQEIEIEKSKIVAEHLKGRK